MVSVDRPSSALRLPGLALAGLLAGALLLPMFSRGMRAQTTSTRESGAASEGREFTWAMASSDLGTVAVAADTNSNGEGWVEIMPGACFRAVPSFTTDPTYEVLLDPPHSGHINQQERFLVQIPRDFRSKAFQDQVLVIGMHSYSISEKQIFLYTELPQVCAERGWMLLAPYGLNDTHFGHPASQESLRSVVRFLFQLMPFNYRRIYGVGFSMGALASLSFAMRHQDPYDVQMAGVVFHSGRIDQVRNYEDANWVLQWLLRDSMHFGGSPSEVPFEYDRVSPARVLPNGIIYQDRAPVTNMLHLPVYIHANLADPDTELLGEVLELRSFLLSRGARVYESFVYDPLLGHSWDTLDLRHALDAIGQHELPLGADPVEFFVDEPGRFQHTEALEITPGWHGHYEVSKSPPGLGTLNGFALHDCRDIRKIAVDLRRLGLSTSQPLSFEVTGKGFFDMTVVLQGVTQQPSSVTRDGGNPTPWIYDPAAGELSMDLLVGGIPTLVDITP